MGRPTVNKGDIWFVSNRTRLGRFINWGQRLTSFDNQSVYNHCGLFLDDRGTTLEALWHVTSNNFFERYKRKKVLIVSPMSSEETKFISTDFIRSEEFGKSYPVYGFLYMIAPPLAKYIGDGSNLMCSELVAKYLYKIGIRPKYYKGTTPDRLVDEVRHWKDYNITFEGNI